MVSLTRLGIPVGTYMCDMRRKCVWPKLSEGGNGKACTKLPKKRAIDAVFIFPARNVLDQLSEEPRNGPFLSSKEELA